MTTSYRFDILRNKAPIGQLYAQTANIKFDSSSMVMRALQLTMRADDYKMHKSITKTASWLCFDSSWCFDGTKCFVDSIYSVSTYVYDIITDRIRPVLIIDGVEYSLGTFMTWSSPKDIGRKNSHYSIEAYDETMIIKQAKLDTRAYFASGSSYLSAIESYLVTLGFGNIYADECMATFTADKEYPIGQNVLEMLNELLEEIGFYPIHITVTGYIMLQKKKTETSPKHIYRDHSNNMRLLDSLKQTIDLYSIPNVFIGVVSNPDSSPIVYKRENTDLSSILSIPNRGYRVVEKYELNSTSSQEVLQDYIDQKYTESLQSVEQVEFETAPEPEHEYLDPVQIDTAKLRGLYQETSWEMDLAVSAKMKHTAERKVFL